MSEQTPKVSVSINLKVTGCVLNSHFVVYGAHATLLHILLCPSDMEYAQCMRNVLTAVNSSDLVALLEQTRLASVEQAEHADSQAAGQSSR